MVTTPEKLMLAGSAVVALVAFVTLTQGHVEQVELQRAVASPDALEACSKIAGKAHGPFSQSKDAVIEECLIQRDPVYAAAREAAMCQQAKVAGAKPENFSAEFRRSCFGNV